jgi:hypothetical protein
MRDRASSRARERRGDERGCSRRGDDERGEDATGQGCTSTGVAGPERPYRARQRPSPPNARCRNGCAGIPLSGIHDSCQRSEGARATREAYHRRRARCRRADHHRVPDVRRDARGLEGQLLLRRVHGLRRARLDRAPAPRPACERRRPRRRARATAAARGRPRPLARRRPARVRRASSNAEGATVRAAARFVPVSIPLPTRFQVFNAGDGSTGLPTSYRSASQPCRSSGSRTRAARGSGMGSRWRRRLVHGPDLRGAP